MKTTNVAEWLNSGEYLPPPLRDFHDQKDLFKAIHQIIDVKAIDYTKDMNFVTGQVYVIDVFLWFMARRGYTLQRTRRRGDFRSLEADVKAARDARNGQLAGLLDTPPNTHSPTESSG